MYQTEGLRKEGFYVLYSGKIREDSNKKTEVNRLYFFDYIGIPRFQCTFDMDHIFDCKIDQSEKRIIVKNFDGELFLYRLNGLSA